MAEVIEIRLAALRRLAAQTDPRGDPKPSLSSEDAANEAALAQPRDLDEDSLRAFRGFAAATAIGAVLWVVGGALILLGLP